MHLRRPRRVGSCVDLDGHRRTLADLSADSAAEIVALDPSVPDDLLNRLRHLGFRPGIRVVKLLTAPLGDPAVYRLLGYNVCLRKREAAYIEVAEDD